MKLIVSDFDLTFFDNNYDENIKKINEFIIKGNMFVIATGRPYEMLKKDIINKKINYEYLICTDGAVILDKNNKVIYNNNIDNNTADKILSLIKNDKNTDRIFIDKINENICGIYGHFIDKNKAQEKVNEINQNYKIFSYLSAKWINILNSNVSKIDGIEYLRNKLNISDKDIYTIGDNINDLTMINKYNGYVIKNGTIYGKYVNDFIEFMNTIEK